MKLIKINIDHNKGKVITQVYYIWLHIEWIKPTHYWYSFKNCTVLYMSCKGKVNKVI